MPLPVELFIAVPPGVKRDRQTELRSHPRNSGSYFGFPKRFFWVRVETRIETNRSAHLRAAHDFLNGQIGPPRTVTQMEERHPRVGGEPLIHGPVVVGPPAAPAENGTGWLPPGKLICPRMLFEHRDVDAELVEGLRLGRTAGSLPGESPTAGCCLRGRPIGGRQGPA